MSFWQGKKILITGGNGFVGKSVLEILAKKDILEIISPKSSEYDLTVEKDVIRLFKDNKPDYVIHLAGKVGGVLANKMSPGEFFYKNIMMGSLIMQYARLNGVKKLVALAAGCGYPKHLEVPFKESDFWLDLPDENSIGYSMAKKMLIIQSWTYREQFNFNSSILLPANIYGPNDNFDLENSHVVPALIRKFVEAKDNKKNEVIIWGSGTASREFLHVKDTAKAILDVLELYNESGPLNLGTGVPTTIKELVILLKELTNFDGNIVWDKSKPDGQPKRYYDMSLFKKHIGYIPQISLREGLQITIDWFNKNKHSIN